MSERLSPRAAALVIAGGLLFVAAVAYLFLVSPKRTEAARLQGEIETTQATVDRLRSEGPSRAADLKLTDLVRLAKAMPKQTDMPGILLELNRIAVGTGASFTSITPLPAVLASGYSVVPMQVVFEGSFGQLTAVLERLRTRVDLKRGTLRVRGRLYTIDAVDLAEGTNKFPQLKATMTLGAFLYSGAPAPAPLATTSSSGDQPVAAGATR